jgi:hypothetical protein
MLLFILSNFISAFVGLGLVFIFIVQEPLSEKEIEELIAEFLKVESKVCISLIEFNLSVKSMFASVCLVSACILVFECIHIRACALTHTLKLCCLSQRCV